MHVLAIRMKAMMSTPGSPAPAIADIWSNLTSSDCSGQSKMILRHNKVPLLMQDPLALMTHLILLLPLNVDMAFFRTVTRACFNLQLVQTLVRVAFTLSFSERSLLRGEFHQISAADQRFSRFSGVLGQVIDLLESTSLFSEEEDVIEMASDEETSAVMLDVNSLETEAARLLIPFLRTASLMKHYVYKEDLPDIKEDDEEFDQLVKFLDLVQATTSSDLDDVVPMDSEDVSFQPIAKRVAIVDCIEWFKNGDELTQWASEFVQLACKDHLPLARKAMRVNVLWKQPQLLKLHQNFDLIFQVSALGNS